MKKFFLFLCSITPAALLIAQVAPKDDPKAGGLNNTGMPGFTIVKQLPATPVKNQAMTGTCWSFSTTSLVESQSMKYNTGELDLSEMFTVRNIYIEKAKNYVLRQGHAQFGEGGLGHDQIRAIALYGAIPESVYSGLKAGSQAHDHQKLFVGLQRYLDTLIAHKPVADDWLAGYISILDSTLGAPPQKFEYMGRTHTPQSFAKDVLRFNANDYVAITSFTHHPYYEPFILEVPDNYSNGAYYNIPMTEMLQLTKDAINAGYSISWDADVSNDGFMPQGNPVAINFSNVTGKPKTKNDLVSGKGEDGKWDAESRQKLFENLTTQDDHLMHITGLERSESGGNYFLVKNSWGNQRFNGYINVSESYFAINTISLIVPKAALGKAMLEKLKIK